MSINVQQLSCISKQWNIENLSPISQSKEKLFLVFLVSSFFVDSILYGENLSLLFKCIRKENDNDSVQMKHIYLSNDETMKDKYVKNNLFYFKNKNFIFFVFVLD